MKRITVNLASFSLALDTVGTLWAVCLLEHVFADSMALYDVVAHEGSERRELVVMVVVVCA